VGRGVQGAVLKALRAPEYRLRVTAVAERAPYTDITVSCPPLLGPSGPGLPPTAWVRMWIPDGDRERQRAYTLTRMDPAEGTAHVLVLHHEPSGPASRWALSTVPGDEIAIQVMGGTRYRAPEAGQRLLLLADPASAPAMVDAVENATSCPTTVVLLRDDDVPLPTREHRLIRREDDDEDTIRSAIEEALDHGLPDWVWVALESGRTRRAVTLLRAAGVGRRAIQSQAYWIAGRPMGT